MGSSLGYNYIKGVARFCWAYLVQVHRGEYWIPNDCEPPGKGAATLTASWEGPESIKLAVHLKENDMHK